MAKLTDFIDTEKLYGEIDAAVNKFGFERGLSVMLQACNRHLRAAERKRLASESKRLRVRKKAAEKSESQE